MNCNKITRMKFFINLLGEFPERKEGCDYMQFDYSAAKQFFAYLEGKRELVKVLDSPAYQAVFSHSRKTGTELTIADVELAIQGKPTDFYGLKNLQYNLPSLKRLLALLEDKEAEWLSIIEEAITELLPNENHSDITIYPIIGYDAGIGHRNAVCMNINLELYLNNPLEFLYLAIHECFHAVYEHIHPFPQFTKIKTAGDQLSVFYYLLHNEGYAVYAPLKLRMINNHLGNYSDPVLADYPIVFKKKEIIKHLRVYDTLILNVKEKEDMSMDPDVKKTFGYFRLAYRIGCTLVRRIEAELGMEEVRKGIYLSPAKFIKKYSELLNYFR